MQLPFTADQFNDIFRAYNTAVWPAQVGLTALAVVAIGLVIFRRRWSGLGISAILAVLWAWLGIAYHLVFFTAINPLAYAFAVMAIIGAASLFWQGVIRRRIEFGFAPGIRTVAGVVLIVFALVAYPAWSHYAGHVYPILPTFGLPCPTTIFTIGMIALAIPPYPRSPLVVPVLWCFVGAQAAFLLQVPQDLGLLAAAIVGIGLFVRPGVSAPLERGNFKTHDARAP